MKKLIYTLVLGLVLVPSVVSAAQIEGGNQFVLPVGESVMGNLYVGSGSASILGQVVGDLYIAAGNTVISGQVTDDLVIVGGNTTVNGNVGGDVRVIGGQVLITGTVGGDIMVIAGTLNAGGETLGDVDFIGTTFTLSPTAMVGGDVTYRSDRRGNISEGAYVAGDLIYDKTLAQRLGITGAGNESFKTTLLALFGAWLFLKLLMIVFGALVIYWLLSEPLLRVVKTALKTPARLMVMGFATLVAVPVLVVILAVTVIGVPLAILIACGYGVGLMLAKLMSGAVLGAWAEKYLRKRSELRVTWQNVLLGTVALFVLSYIPVLGWVLTLALMVLVLGTLLEIGFRRWQA